jgi:hypothetical protein
VQIFDWSDPIRVEVEVSMEHNGRDGMVEHPDLHIEADAVCEQCSSVNPPGTLLCKMCGNNLRDQRTRRLSADGPAIVMEDTMRPRRVLAGLLIVLGLLLVLWTAFSVSKIESLLTRGLERASSTADPESYWTSSAATIYDDLAKEMKDRPISDQEARMALMQSNLTSGFDGRYVLKRSEEAFAPVIGQAIVRTVGESVYFVAFVLRENEFRGEARLTSPTILEVKLVGANTPGGYRGAYGVAQITPKFLYCSGYTMESETLIEGFAFRVPEAANGVAPAAGTPVQ